MRNATVTTIAPTGTISIICGASSGVEPVFALSYNRNVMDSRLLEVHPYFKEIALKEGFLFGQADAEDSGKDEHTVFKGNTGRNSQGFLLPRTTFSPEYHIRIQAAFSAVYGQCGIQDGELPQGSVSGGCKRKSTSRLTS